MKTLTEILGQELIDRIKRDNLKASTTTYNSSIDLMLFQKWAYRVGKGWYGFDLGSAVPYSWAEAISLVLKELDTEAPEFVIHQIKLKFGGLRFYVELNDTDKDYQIEKTISELEGLLFSPTLVY